MRIVAGTHRGRRLRAPAGTATRPTADRVREAVFSIVGPVDGAWSAQFEHTVLIGPHGAEITTLLT